jgi:N-acetylmuramoyl-L-alanine amidase
MTIYPSLENPFVAALSPESLRLSTLLHDEMVKVTGTKSGGIRAMDDLTGINWAQMPVSLVELGYMSNPEEDVLLSTPQYQDQLVEGLVRGIQRFFENLP